MEHICLVLGQNLNLGVAKKRKYTMGDFMRCVLVFGIDVGDWEETAPPPDVVDKLCFEGLHGIGQKLLSDVNPDKVCVAATHTHSSCSTHHTQHRHPPPPTMQASPEFKEEGEELCAIYSEAWQCISHAIDQVGIAPQLNEWRTKARIQRCEINSTLTTGGTDGGGSAAQEQQEPQQPSEDPPATETNKKGATGKRQQQQQQEQRQTRQQCMQQHQQEADEPQQEDLPLKKRRKK